LCCGRGTYDPFFSEDELAGYNSAWSSRGLSSHNLKKAPDSEAYTGSRSYLYSGAPAKQVKRLKKQYAILIVIDV
jgi:hypothetical protein